jgi:hypothetical protein
LIKLLIIEELKRRHKTWGYFLFWSEFTFEEDPDNPLGKKRVKKGKHSIAPDTTEASTSRTRRRIDFLDDPKYENMVIMKRAKVVAWKERLKEYRVCFHM